MNAFISGPHNVGKDHPVASTVRSYCSMIYTLLGYFEINLTMKRRKAMVSQDFYRTGGDYSKLCKQDFSLFP